ncbi:Transposon Tf2-8 polyprotein [Folsomia candida]|uniref:RNA-directed DNA polymerase n=1 Tax=Folsomia candida TaxID=158441 RepID=A0A226CYZ1_FOLCA|nr:Transposon Tf2-8 polyprotein [Folsomia candida]
MQSKSKKIARWAQEIQEWGCKFIHCSGVKNIVADCLSRDPVEPLPNEPDHLEGNRDICTPIFALSFCNNFLEKVKSAQKVDINLQVIRKIVENRPLAKEDFSMLEGIPESRKGDFSWFKKRYLVKDEVLFRFVEMFESPDLIASGIDEIDVDVHGSNSMAHTPVSTSGSQNLVAHTPKLVMAHTPVFKSALTPELLALTPHIVRTDLVGRRPVPNRYPVGNVAVPEVVSYPVGKVAVPVVPKSLIGEVMTVFHDSAEAGHMGVKKTQNSIKRRFFWNGMNKDIHEYVKSCKKCQQYKTDRMKPRGLLGNVPIANAVFETIFIDFIGPYPRSFRRRNTYCLVVIDQLSNWVELFPMTKASGEKVAMCLEDQIFCRYGAPKCIITDNGSHFINKKMKKLCKEWSVRHATISAYHPIPSRSERTNQDLIRMIATFIESTHGKWDENIQKFALVLRSMVNDTTQVSPAILNLGREVALPIDRALKTDITQWSEEERLDFAKKLRESIRDLISRVKVRIAKVHESNKKYFDLKRREEVFQVGQEVWIRNHAQSDKDSNINQKFLPKWLGPFKILKRNADTYTMDVCSRLIPKRHVSDLKPYFSRPPRSGKVPISIRKVITHQDPKIPVVRQLRARTKKMSREDLFALDGGNSFSSDIHGGSQFSTASLTKTQQRKIDYIKKLKMFKKPSIPQRCQEYINRRNKFEIYEKIWKWCKEVAQIRDQNRDFITKNQTLRLLQLEKFNFEVVKKILDKIQDSDIKNLCSILNEKKQIDMEWIENERNFEVMEGNFNFEVPRGGSVEFVELEEPVDALGTPGRFNEISEDALGTPGVVKDAKDALGTLDMEIHQPIKDVSKYFKVLSVSTEPCVEELKRQRKIRNYQSRKNWKLKFKLENEERLRKGLSLLKKPYSKGKAWRERGALRKRLGLPIGPTTFTTRR